MNNNSRIFHPELFQGNNKSKHYFEGWYYKHVDKNSKNVLVLIPGVNYQEDEKSAFIQVVVGPEFKSYYLNYDYSEFSWSDNPFQVKIGDNVFSLDGIKINIHKDELSLQGEIKYKNVSSLDKSIINPSIMGIYAYVKNMQCNHGILSLNHELEGKIECNNEIISFDNGKGYIEKDWGTSFPKKYCWIQCNNFENSSVSIFLSIADIPFLFNSFRGFISILKIENKQYRFATYNQSKIVNLIQNGDTLSITLKKKNITLKVKATLKNGTVLKAPKEGIMADEIKETLSGSIDVSLFDNEKLIYHGIGNRSGIEVVNLI